MRIDFVIILHRKKILTKYYFSLKKQRSNLY